MPDIIFRPALRSDLDGLFRLYEQLGAIDSCAAPEDASVIWDEVEANPRIRYFVAASNETVLSTCNVTVIPNLTHGGRPFAIIENVVTDSGWRGKGLGKRVMGMAIDFARKSDCYKVCLLSGAARTEAHAFYRSLGFSGDSKVGFDLRL